MRTLEFCQSLLDLSEHFETMVKRKREEQDLGNSEGPATKHANTLQGTRQPVYLLILKTWYFWEEILNSMNCDR